MLPFDVIQIIFEYLNRNDRHKLLQFVPDLDEREILILEDKAAAILILFPKLFDKNIDDTIIVHHDGSAEYTYDSAMGNNSILLKPNKYNDSFEELIKDYNFTYNIRMFIDQRPKYDDMFIDENIDVTVNEEFVIEDDILKTLILNITKKFINFQDALDFTLKPFFQPLRDIINKTFFEKVRMVMDLM